MNNFLTTEGQVLATSLQNVSAKVMEFLPNIVLAVIVFLIGWFVASAVATAVSQVIKALKVDGALKNIGLQDFMNILRAKIGRPILFHSTVTALLTAFLFSLAMRHIKQLILFLIS